MQQSKGKTEPKFLTPRQVAEILMVSPITVRQWAQKGQLRAYTTPGGHRRFRLMDVEAFARENNVVIPTGRHRAVRILIVDDDENLLGFLSKLFADVPEAEVVVETASSGFEGGLKVQSLKPDVFLLDLMMPGMNGFEVCKRIKQDPVTADIRVVAMTGFPTRENVDRILAAGAEACFPKPLQISALLDHLGLHPKTRLLGE